VRKADNLPPSCAVVTKSGNFNFLESSGPVQACNGTALPFYFKLWSFINFPPLSAAAKVKSPFLLWGILCQTTVISLVWDFRRIISGRGDLNYNVGLL